jgi:hypothetical protein
MVSASRFISVLAGGCLLCLGLSSCYMGLARTTAPAATESIKGEVLRVEGQNYVVKREDGKEVSLHTDLTTRKMGDISEGYKIEAEVNAQNHAVSIRSTPTTDRRNEKSDSMLVQ